MLDFISMLEAGLDERDEHGRKWGDARWGCYAFYDYDGEPIYVGQTNERLRARVRRHLTNQRTDPVAMRILDVFEVAELELWPLWDLNEVTSANDVEMKVKYAIAKKRLDATEYTIYRQAIKESKFHAVLNEKSPPISQLVELPESRRFTLISPANRRERGHPDTRIARRAEALSRLSAVAHERGSVSTGLRRVLVTQAVRLAYLAADRYTEIRSLPHPDGALFDVAKIIGESLFDMTDDDSVEDE